MKITAEELYRNIREAKTQKEYEHLKEVEKMIITRVLAKNGIKRSDEKGEYRLTDMPSRMYGIYAEYYFS